MQHFLFCPEVFARQLTANLIFQQISNYQMPFNDHQGCTKYSLTICITMWDSENTTTFMHYDHKMNENRLFLHILFYIYFKINLPAPFYEGCFFVINGDA